MTKIIIKATRRRAGIWSAMLAFLLLVLFLAALFAAGVIGAVSAVPEVLR